LKPNQVNRYTWTQAAANRLIADRGSMSRYELSRRLRARLGIFGENEISKFEKGQKQTIKAELLELICQELETTVEFIIYGER
jgi:DNA-binding Xre family transcriptional regulator